jgi:hypothetical protein
MNERWYCVTNDGLAELCASEEAARKEVIFNDKLWPNKAPHKAVQLGDVAALRAEIEALRAVLADLTVLVRGECPALLDDDSHGDGELSIRIDAVLASARAAIKEPSP